jgi:hypothetical protein
MDEFASRLYPVREDMRFQRRSWMVERAGWLVLTAIALAALTGVFGNGPLSTARAGAGPLTVVYERFQRATRTTRFEFEIAPGPRSDATLHLGGAFLRQFEIASIQPRPLTSTAGPDGVDLTFAARPNAGRRVVIWTRSRHYGLSRITAAADAGAAAAFWVFVYP